ncbi:MAG: RCC1 repeat- and reductase domain-containing protein [Magnetococcales bacterium]|nr:RCC1 repeat- and reductase domain-containing protein [Magnetococcales bacterium]
MKYPLSILLFLLAFGPSMAMAVEPMVATGIYHTLALKSNGTVWSWGYNNYGQLGDGTTRNHFNPAEVPALSDVVAIGAAYNASYAVKSDGTVWAWGNNALGQLGNGTVTSFSTDPLQIPGLEEVVAITGGNSFAVALQRDGGLMAWGSRSSGRLGDGSIDFNQYRFSPEKVVGPEDIVSVSAGDGHAAAVASDGTLWVWGDNSYGQLGTGGIGVHALPVSTEAFGEEIIDVSVGCWHTLALQSNGQLMASGGNFTGQLGDGTTEEKENPVAVLDITDVETVSAFCQSSAVLKSDGTVWTWGENSSGILGVGSAQVHHSPVEVPDLFNMMAISSNGMHMVVVDNNGAVWSWGYNGYGELGDGTFSTRYSPVQVVDANGEPFSLHAEEVIEDCDEDGLADEEDEDDDNDGLPDEFEADNLLDRCNPDDAEDDFDGDGYTNLEEYDALTNPGDARSNPDTVGGEVTAESATLEGGVLRIPRVESPHGSVSMILQSHPPKIYQFHVTKSTPLE